MISLRERRKYELNRLMNFEMGISNGYGILSYSAVQDGLERASQSIQHLQHAPNGTNCHLGKLATSWAKISVVVLSSYVHLACLNDSLWLVSATCYSG